MKFKLFFLIAFVLSCSPQLSSINQKKPYSAKGFAYIYNDFDFKEKIIKGKMNNDIMQISHQKLRVGALIKIINPKNEEIVVLKNTKRIKHPDFYKILITKPVAEKLNLNLDLPILEIIEIKKNKSFVAEKAKMYREEKKISSKAPVDSVEISNISKNIVDERKKKTDNIFIHIGTFYSIDVAKFDDKKLKIKKINNKEIQVISGPYTSVNLLKNDYIMLKNFGFEELDIFINE